MRATTRRGFLAGALASGAAVPASVARAAEPEHPGPIRATRPAIHRGRAIAAAPDGSRIVVAHEGRRTIAVGEAGRDAAALVDVGGQPLSVAVSPDGRLAAVTTASWDEPGLALVDLDAVALLERIAVGPAPYGVAFAADGERAVVSGGEQDGTLHVVDLARRAVVAEGAIGTVPRAVAADPGAGSAWVALAGAARLARVELADARVSRELEVPRFPEAVAVGEDGALIVTHGGPAAENVTLMDPAGALLARVRAGRHPSGAAWAGTRRLVALGGEGAIVEVGPSGVVARHDVGGAPRGLAVAGGRALSADALGGPVREARL